MSKQITPSTATNRALCHDVIQESGQGVRAQSQHIPNSGQGVRAGFQYMLDSGQGSPAQSHTPDSGQGVRARPRFGRHSCTPQIRAPFQHAPDSGPIPAIPRFRHHSGTPNSPPNTYMPALCHDAPGAPVSPTTCPTTTTTAHHGPNYPYNAPRNRITHPPSVHHQAPRSCNPAAPRGPVLVLAPCACALRPVLVPCARALCLCPVLVPRASSQCIVPCALCPVSGPKIHTQAESHDSEFSSPGDNSCVAASSVSFVAQRA